MDEKLAKAIAEALQEEFSIGTWSHFCDEVDFDRTSDEEIAAVILRAAEALRERP